MKTFLLFLFVILPVISFAQKEYEPSELYPYGLPNPEAPEQLSDFAPMIGTCECISTRRIDQDTWADDEKMEWEFKYIMNGTAIQDQTFKSDGKHAGSIRQFHSDSAKWYVYYYSTSFVPGANSTWSGTKVGDNIILYMDQKAPNGMEGVSRLTFSGISESGFNWIGEWTTPDESIVYPFWKIECKKKMQ